ncbi:MAG: hypothetical protein WC812_01875 [Candidatus Pacearchaeota archaeon]|jgi:hypothetical protein
MIIRQAEEKDINEILGLFEKLQINLNYSDNKPGFFKYSKSYEELKNFLNPYFFVAENQGKVKGFNLACSVSFLKNNFSNTSSLEKKFILKNVQGNYVYVDSFAVEDYSKLISGRVAEKLFNNLMNLSKKRNVSKLIGCVCHEPYYNSRSANCLVNNGFKLTNEIKIEDNILLGLYQKFLKK